MGAVAVVRQWCYPEWKHVLENHPKYRDLALAILERYPELGFSRAKEAGWRPRASTDAADD